MGRRRPHLPVHLGLLGRRRYRLAETWTEEGARWTSAADRTDDRHEARRYEIRLKGHLDSSWAEWLGGMSLTHASDGTTVLVGPVVDQAALHGLLQKLRDLGITLISVNEDEIDPPIVRDDPSELLNPTTRRST